MADRSLTKAEWLALEGRLSYPSAQARLLCDGYEATLQVVFLKKLQLAIRIFVNGVWKGAWGLKDCEERRRFFSPAKYPVFKTKAIQDAERELAKLLRRPSRHSDTIVVYRPYWTDFTALRRHLERNNNDIKLLSPYAEVEEEITPAPHGQTAGS